MKRFLSIFFTLAFSGSLVCMSQDKQKMEPLKQMQFAQKVLAQGKQEEALTLFKQIANSTDPAFQLYVSMAEYNIGNVYYQRNDFDSAILWYRKGAMRNNANAQHNLAVTLRDRNSNTADSAEKKRAMTEAKVWLEIAALQGDATACNTLGVMYGQESQTAGTEDAKKESLLSAIHCFKKATELESSAGNKILSSEQNRIIFEEVQDDDHAIVDAYNNLGMVYKALYSLESDLWLQEQFIDKSIEAYSQALKRGSLKSQNEIQILQPMKERLCRSRIARSLSTRN